MQPLLKAIHPPLTQQNRAMSYKLTQTLLMSCNLSSRQASFPNKQLGKNPPSPSPPQKKQKKHTKKRFILEKVPRMGGGVGKVLNCQNFALEYLFLAGKSLFEP